MLQCISPVLARFDRSLDAELCPESGEKQKCRTYARSDAIDPKLKSRFVGRRYRPCPQMEQQDDNDKGKAHYQDEKDSPGPK
jgi:hypothetical protein